MNTQASVTDNERSSFAETRTAPTPDRVERRHHLRLLTEQPTTSRLESLRARISKRILDLVFVIPPLLILLVGFPFMALAVKLTSRGPILFRQTRVGRGGEPITIWKLRTMYVDAEERLKADPELYRIYVENGYKVPKHLDKRVTPLGRIMRTLSLDELPQVMNVLRNEMSLVGPRPVLPEELDFLYGENARFYKVCKPGLTGKWQVSGRCEVVREGRVNLDIAYVKNWTLRGDVALIAKTIPAVLQRRGAF